MSDGWEDRAEGWIAWARKPSHDAYSTFRDAFFGMLPPPQGQALEVGCGEGRVCRDLPARGGHDVVGLDASPSLVAAEALESVDLVIEALNELKGGTTRIAECRSSSSGAH